MRGKKIRKAGTDRAEVSIHLGERGAFIGYRSPMGTKTEKTSLTEDNPLKKKKLLDHI